MYPYRFSRFGAPYGQFGVYVSNLYDYHRYAQDVEARAAAPSRAEPTGATGVSGSVAAPLSMWKRALMVFGRHAAT